MGAISRNLGYGPVFFGNMPRFPGMILGSVPPIPSIGNGIIPIPIPVSVSVSVWMSEKYRYLYESSAWYRYRYECSFWYRYRYRYGGIGGTLILGEIPALRRRGTHSPPATPHHLQHCTTCSPAPPAKSKIAARWPQNCWRGLEKCLPLLLW